MNWQRQRPSNPHPPGTGNAMLWNFGQGIIEQRRKERREKIIAQIRARVDRFIDGATFGLGFGVSVLVVLRLAH